MSDYKPFHQKSAVQAQTSLIGKAKGPLGANLEQTVDGLWLVPGTAALQEQALGSLQQLQIPTSVIEWMRDLALLRKVPLAYLVPDPELLPPESIRFFHVDRSWTDRLIDGSLWAANLGTLDMTYRMRTLVELRSVVADALDQLVTYDDDDDEKYAYPWTAHDLQAPITGMLIRSELVRRWPDLEVAGFRVQAFSGVDKRPTRNDRVRLLRREVISRDLMIVLFAGTPIRVEVKEPPVAIRFGVERAGQGFVVNLRNVDGQYIGATTVAVPQRTVQAWGSSAPRVIEPSTLATNITSKWPSPKPRSSAGPRDVGLNLEQLPYVQVFMGGDEPEGSKPLASAAPGKLGRAADTTRRGIHLSKLAGFAKKDGK
jgi:hypothetical protein